MKTLISSLMLAATIGFGGSAFAQDAMSAPMAGDAMSTPMAGDAMASDAMGGDAMSTTTPDEILTACLAKADMETDAMKKDEATKACHDAHNTAGDAMMAPDAAGGDAMSAEPMAPESAMAPAQ